MKKWGKKIGTKDANMTNRMQKMEKRISGIGDTIEISESFVKQTVNLKFPNTKHPRNLEHYAKMKPMNYSNIIRKRIPVQWSRKIYQQNHINFSNLMNDMATKV